MSRENLCGYAEYIVVFTHASDLLVILVQWALPPTFNQSKAVAVKRNFSKSQRQHKAAGTEFPLSPLSHSG